MLQLLRDKAIHTALTGDWKTAVDLNKELLKEDPKDIDALNRLAMALMVMGKTTTAKTTYQKVLKIDPLNPIALRNLKQLKTSKGKTWGALDLQLNNKFLEETGKTKVIELINTAQPGILQSLRTGESVNLAIKRSRIFVLKGEKQYLGVLPDDIGRRLIKFIKSGNKYEAYIKSSNTRKVVVFIKELKRGNKYKNQPSFLSPGDSLFDKKDRIRDLRADEDQEEPTEN
jgi:hypothetical protein